MAKATKISSRRSHSIKGLSMEGNDSIGETRKMNPRYNGPFEILARIGPVAYRLQLPAELNNVHPVFHVSNLKKCLSDETLVVPLEEI